MTDKLAEALEYFDNDGAEKEDPYAITFSDKLLIIAKASRSYHALPVVDVETLKRPEGNGNLEYELMDRAHNECLEMLQTRFPNGLIWKV